MLLSRIVMAAATAVTALMMTMAAEAATQKRSALVIGNSNYKSSPLSNPENDARAMGKSLRRLGFDVTQVIDGDRNQMIRAIRLFGKKLRKGGGVGLFYYAGHGVQVGGENYLIPLKAKIDGEPDVELESVRVTRVMAELDKAENGLNIVILDACRNNPFARSFRSADKGLAQMRAPVGTLLAYATAPGSVAADGAGSNGLYTSQLLRAMNTPGAKVEDVFKDVRRGVRKGSGGKQIPWESTSIEGDFYFVPPKGGTQTAALSTQGTTRPAPQGPNKEVLFWQSVKDSSDAASYRAYLEQYPNGTYAGLAKVRVRGLERKTAAISQSRTPDNRPSSVAVRPAPPPPPPQQQALGIFPRPDPGATTLIRDCDDCPEMVVLPSSTFRMGSPNGERGRMANEGPLHAVSVRSFAIGKYEVTFDEWNACVKARGCEHKPKDEGWGRKNRPVIGVSWSDAQQYAVWLTEKTGKEYRLPTESEWEYAARAGSSSSYPWGKHVSRNKANCNMCGSRYDRKKTAPVGKFKPNAFGLHDMVGNVWEWLEDCWNETYAGAPNNGEPWMEGQCSSRVLRGGSWRDPAKSVRSATRLRYFIGSRFNFFGFRVARSVN